MDPQIAAVVIEKSLPRPRAGNKKQTRLPHLLPPSDASTRITLDALLAHGPANTTASRKPAPSRSCGRRARHDVTRMIQTYRINKPTPRCVSLLLLRPTTRHADRVAAEHQADGKQRPPQPLPLPDRRHPGDPRGRREGRRGRGGVPVRGGGKGGRGPAEGGGYRGGGVGAVPGRRGGAGDVGLRCDVM